MLGKARSSMREGRPGARAAPGAVVLLVGGAVVVGLQGPATGAAFGAAVPADLVAFVAVVVGVDQGDVLDW
ncbi:hypothetical protein [Kitasatospora sp. NPDC017646]|uniref:hypothetical protein n=1 Tax=Kitasatospora sp. NPDC017646 TaxID=3364024 RepID=UPI00378AD1F1